jgi:hypothetical protein
LAFGSVIGLGFYAFAGVLLGEGRNPDDTIRSGSFEDLDSVERV